MSKDDVIEMEGKVVEVLPNASFRVELIEKTTSKTTNKSSKIILCNISGKLRMNNIRVMLGDIVKLEMSMYDLTRGRITWRSKGKEIEPTPQT